MVKSRAIFIAISILGLLILLAILAGPLAPLLVQLRIEPVCIQGDLPNIRIVSCPQPGAAEPIVTPFPFPTPRESSPIPIIVDDDGSPDGIVALLYFLRHPHYDVRAVTISAGEAHPDVFANHVTRLLAAVDRPDIPVGVGTATPLAGDNAFPEPWRQSSDAFWGLSLPDAPQDALDPVPAAELIVRILSTSDSPVTLFLSGPHTNLAQALRLDPHIREQIRDVYMMGGAIRVAGNIQSDWPAIANNVAEWNIWVDPVATSEVFQSGLPLTIVPLDATARVTWTASDARSWAAPDTPAGSMAASLLQWMLDSWGADAVHVWDLAAAVASTDPRLCPPVDIALDVETAPGANQGRTIVSDDPSNAAVCLEPDATQIRARSLAILGR